MSATTRHGIDELLKAMSDHLVPRPPPSGAAVPFSQDQMDLLFMAKLALGRGDIEGALQVLDMRMPGENS
ncbi:MAG: hypothetical protein MI757_11465 [Pirellulales bacterium]|nr:hypothetical protein [Pirellulales bacterium]